jgi:hypothetical protein
MLLSLLRHPQATIRSLIEEENARWLVPIAGFSFVSFAEGYGRIVTALPAWSAIALILLTAAGALAIGSWTWAGIFGGLLHGSSRLLKGREGVSKTIRAVGYAFFWPGLVAALNSIAVISLGYRGTDLPLLATLPLVLQVCAGLWGVYTVVSALRVRHGFGWGRAVIAYLLPFVALLAVVIAFLVVTGAI